jgi:hypothetical protein
MNATTTAAGATMKARSPRSKTPMFRLEPFPDRERDRSRREQDATSGSASWRTAIAA